MSDEYQLRKDVDRIYGDIYTLQSDMDDNQLNVYTKEDMDSKLSSTYYDKSDVDVKLNQLIDIVYPIGSIYMSVNSVDPSTLFGGVWEKIEDTFLLASGTTYSNGDSGGEATHILTENEMPSHTHTQNAHHHGTGHSTYDKFLATNVNVALGQTKRNLPSTGSNYYFAYSTELGNIQEVDNTANATATNQNKGGGQAHNNMPPYLTVNVWKRIE